MTPTWENQCKSLGINKVISRNKMTPDFFELKIQANYLMEKANGDERILK